MSISELVKGAAVLDLAYLKDTAIPGNSCVIFGDSITEHNYTYTPYSRISFNSNGYWAWANAMMGHRMRLLNNAGVNGNTTAQMLARISSDVLAYNPAWCFVMGGIDDAYSNGYSAATTISNLQQIYEILTANGINIVALTITPVGSGYAKWSAAAQTNTLIVNEWIKQYVRDHSNMVLIDTYNVMVNPTDANGYAKTGWTQSADYIHPNNVSCLAIGQQIASVLDPLMPNVQGLVSSNADNYGYNASNLNIQDNGLFQGATGTKDAAFTGTVADGFNVTAIAGSPACACSTSARTDGYGNNQVLSITPSAANDSVHLQGASVQARVSAGQTLVGECEVTLSNPNNITNLYLQLLTQTSSGNYIAYDMFPVGAGSDTNFATGFTATFRTPPITIRTGDGAVSLVRQDVVAIFSAAGTANTIETGRMSLRIQQ